jgi:catechol 2,3-dioxygenase-like lactoylglutathione lyase family enzyme
MRLAHIALLIEDYDEAIEWLTRCLDFKVLEDTPMEGKRWILMQPQGGGCSFVLSKAKNTRQRIGVGNQFAGRVGFFLHTDDFAAAESRLRQNDVRIVREPEDHPYGRVLVFKDMWGNMWDLVQPSAE